MNSTNMEHGTKEHTSRFIKSRYDGQHCCSIVEHVGWGLDNGKKKEAMILILVIRLLVLTVFKHL
jgi:hypothetical protein